MAETFDNCSENSRIELRFCVETRATGLTIRAGLIGQTIVAIHSDAVVFCYHAQEAGNPRITRESPFLEAVDTSHLDENGIVVPGTVVTEDMIAVSAVLPVVGVKRSLKDKRPLGEMLNSSDVQEVRDGSSFFGLNYLGYTVTAIKRENIRDQIKNFEPGLIDRLTVSLERHDHLKIGDLLEVAGCSIPIVGVLPDDLMPKDEHHQPVDAICPMFDSTLDEGVLVDGAIVQVKVSRQYPIARDTVKARSIGPYSLFTMMPLGSRSVRGGQCVDATEIGWLLEHGYVATAAELVGLKCDDLLNRHQLRELAEGKKSFPLSTDLGGSEMLFLATEELRLLGLAVDCESRNNCVEWRIAPADLNWLLKAATQEVKKPETINYRTYRPEPGGLFCAEAFGPESHSRRQRAARFELAASIVPIIFRIGENPILCQVLGLEAEVIESLVGWRSGLSQDLDVVSIDAPNCQFKGARAIERLLRDCGRKLPFDPTRMIQDHVYVIPPDYRPIIRLDNGTYATSDLNDHYRRLINRSNRLRKLCLLNAPQIIIDNETQDLQMCTDRLQANSWSSSPFLGGPNRPLRSGLDIVLPKLCGKEPKRVDWSASARAIVDNDVPQPQCTLPASIFDCLCCNSDEPLLLTTGGCFVACKPQRREELVIRLHPDTAAKLNIRFHGVCVVHRPITTGAVADAKRMSAMDNAAGTQSTRTVDVETPLEMLLSRILSGEPLLLDSPQLFLLGGSGSLRRLPDQDNPLPKDDSRVVRKPTLVTPSLTELRAIAESTERVSNVLRLIETDKEPPPNQGRIGGRPWLPANIQWPRTVEGVPVPFFAQLPISPTLNDTLPFPVNTDMLLTLFWHEEWWEPKATSAPYVVLHATDELQLRELPREVNAIPLYRIETQLKKHLPSWEEICQLLQHHFDCQIPKDLLAQLKQDLDIENRLAEEESRIGGHGFWIQSPVEHLLAQITADGPWGFGDSGSLYICGRTPDTLEAIVESH